MSSKKWVLCLIVLDLVGCSAPQSFQLNEREDQPLVKSHYNTLGAHSKKDGYLHLELMTPLSFTWDTVFIKLSHTSDLIQPLTGTLVKSLDLQNGSGTQRIRRLFGIPFPRGSGYVLDVSLFNNGIEGDLVGQAQQPLSILSRNNTCVVSVEPCEMLSLTSFFPAFAFPGETVTLYGKGFSSSSDFNVVTLGPQRAVILASSSSSIAVTVPLLPAGCYPWKVRVGGSLSGKDGFEVR
ncbi:MAG TPA: hypothetical protein DD435_02530 [Cyanobacteria bacterium UBA8530]|nr:hypothetical protein [Cyanobacteria bacterium UBA8530]